MRDIVDLIYWIFIAVSLALAPMWAKFLIGGLVLYLFEIYHCLLEIRRGE